MKYRKLGRTKLKVSVLGVGGGAFYDSSISPEHVRKIISFASSRGVNFIETAEDYDETKLVPGLKQFEDKNSKDTFILSSKSTASYDKAMEEALAASLKKLQTKKIHIYQMQTFTTKEDVERRIEQGALKVLKDAKKKGIIDFIGLSSHRLPAIKEAIKTNEFDVVEMPYSIGQTASEEVIDIAAEHGVGVIAIMTLGGGVLVDRDKESKATSFMTAANAIKYVLSNKKVSTALIGMSSVKHAWENIKAVESGIDLSEKQRKAIADKAINFLGKDFCRSCKGCMPCDVHGWPFEIDTFFRFETLYSKYDYPKYKKEYQKMPIKADKCTKCGKCEARCPYNLPIMKKLKHVHKTLNK